jgi:hypothetical protein
MKTQGHLEVILRFLRTAIVIDIILAGVVGLISYLFGWRTVDAYGAVLLRVGMLLILVACFIGVGGYSARIEDSSAYALSGAGNMSENLMRVAESGQSSLGCFFLLAAAGLGLILSGNVLPPVAMFIKSLFGSAS